MRNLVKVYEGLRKLIRKKSSTKEWRIKNREKAYGQIIKLTYEANKEIEDSVKSSKKAWARS